MKYVWTINSVRISRPYNSRVEAWRALEREFFLLDMPYSGQLVEIPKERIQIVEYKPSKALKKVPEQQKCK